MKNYKIQKGGITHDNFDDEIVALNLVEGKYYSMEDTASYIWQSLQIPVETALIIDELAGLHEGDRKEVSDDVQAFLQQLEAEGLVCEAEELEETDPDLKIKAPGSYSKPLLSIFTDMQEVIALDPVHDVSEKGWPHKKA